MRNIVRQRSAVSGIGAALLLGSFFASGICHAAASATVPVTIMRFDFGGNDYTLVVHPAKADPPDPYMGTCERFEVRGTYGLLRGARTQDAALSRKGHREAMKVLQRAFISGQVVDLGWVGTGFVPVKPGDPCIVKSLALQLLKDDLGEHVLSYHDATSASSD